MPGHPSLCPRCKETLPEVATGAAIKSCPRCGELLARQETGQTSNGSATAPVTNRSLATAIVAVVCLAVIGGAGVLIYQKVLALWPPKAPAAKVAAGPNVASTKTGAEKTNNERPSWSHSRLVVIRPAQGADKRSVVMLGHPYGMTDAEKTRGIQTGLLARELIRQAILVAARDELGLPTRDELLGDAAPGAKANASGDFASITRLNGPASVKICRDIAENAPLLDQDVLPAAGIHDLVNLAQAAEALSRTEFPKVLRASGSTGRRTSAGPRRSYLNRSRVDWRVWGWLIRSWRSASCTRRFEQMVNPRQGWVPWCGATPGSAS